MGFIYRLGLVSFLLVVPAFGENSGGGHADTPTSPVGREVARTSSINYATTFFLSHFPVSKDQADAFAKEAAQGFSQNAAVLGELMGSIKYAMKVELGEFVDAELKKNTNDQSVTDFLKGVAWAIKFDACDPMKPEENKLKLWKRDVCKVEEPADNKESFNSFKSSYLDARELKEVKTAAYTIASELAKTDSAVAVKTKWVSVLGEWNLGSEQAKTKKSALLKSLEALTDFSPSNIRKFNNDLLAAQGFSPEQLKEYASFYSGRFKNSNSDAYKKVEFGEKNNYKGDVVSTLEHLLTPDSNGHLWLHLKEGETPIAIHGGKDQEKWSERKEKMNGLATTFFNEAGNTPLASKYTLNSSVPRGGQPPAKESFRKVNNNKIENVDDTTANKWLENVGSAHLTKVKLNEVQPKVQACINCHSSRKLELKGLEGPNGAVTFGGMNLEEAYAAMKKKESANTAAKVPLAALRTYLDGLKNSASPSAPSPK